jgi:tyrosinase
MAVATVRKNQATWTTQDWQTFIAAIDAMHGTSASVPAYRAFVQVHVAAMSMGGMAWGVHTMPQMGMVGRNFLAWHRRFLWQFEQRLQKENPNLAIPYWDWIADPAIPAPLDDAATLRRWSVLRSWTPRDMPTRAEVDNVTAATSFARFQRRLELGPHVDVHVAVGGEDGSGTMNSASSPADPIFWLHHANIDRLWAKWQTDHPNAGPTNPTDILQPAPLFGVAVSTQLSVASLGYSYA